MAQWFYIDAEGYPKGLADDYATGAVLGWDSRVTPLYTPRYSREEKRWVEARKSSDFVNEAKEAKKNELSLSCQEAILSGFNYKVNNVEYHFSYDREAQNNYQERWQLFQNNMIESIVVTGHTLNGEDVRLPMNREQFDKLYLNSVVHKENCIKKLRDDLLPLLNNSNGMKDVESISWDMEVLTPKPETVIMKSDKLLNDEMKRLEAESAQSSGEMMGLIYMAIQKDGMVNG